VKKDQKFGFIDFNTEGALELAFWKMDARIKGYGEWQGIPQSPRDAFKAVVRELFASLAVKS